MKALEADTRGRSRQQRRASHPGFVGIALPLERRRILPCVAPAALFRQHGNRATRQVVSSTPQERRLHECCIRRVYVESSERNGTGDI